MIVNLAHRFTFRLRMSLEKILSTQAYICKELDSLKKELSEVEKLFKQVQLNSSLRGSEQIEKENAFLEQEIKKTQAELVRLETLRGVKQIAIPAKGTSPLLCTPAEPSKPVEVTKPSATAVEESKDAKPKKEAKKKEKPEKQDNKKEVASEGPVDVSRLDLRIGKIIEVKKHPDADSLYVETIDIGTEKPITVVSGLVKHIPIEEMQNRSVILLCNLKPAKMRGITSEAMVMCASTPDKVEVMSPPAGSVPGDLIEVDGFPRQPDSVLNPKKKIWESVAPDLKTDSKCRATYKGALWRVPGKGDVTSQTLVDVNIK